MSTARTVACVSGAMFVVALAGGANELLVLFLGALCILSIVCVVRLSG